MRVAAVLFGVGLVLAILWANLWDSRPDPEPDVRLPPIYVPAPLFCGTTFGDPYCWGPRYALERGEKR